MRSINRSLILALFSAAVFMSSVEQTCASPDEADRFAKAESVKAGFPEMSIGACYGFVCDWVLKAARPDMYADMCQKPKDDMPTYINLMSRGGGDYQAAIDYMNFKGLWAVTLQSYKGRDEDLLRLTREVCTPAMQMIFK
jgi:hypothetical protein